MRMSKRYIRFARLLKVIISFFMINKERIKGCRIKACKKEVLSPKTEINIRGNGLLELGYSVATERGVLLGVRQDAILKIGDGVGINRNSCIVARERIIIGNNVIIAPNVCIYDHDHGFPDPDDYVTAPVVIGDGTWIAANSVILKGVSIGENCVIAAGSVITHNIPDNTVVYQKRQDTLVQRKIVK